MYNGFTLYPNGSFMMCESISEYDNNVHENPEVEEHKNEELKKAFSEDPSYDVTMKLSHKLQPMFSLYKELLDTPYNPTSEDETVQLTDMISNTASTFADQMRLCLVKQKAMLSFVNRNNGCDWTLEPLINNLGFFMKHKIDLIRNGQSRFSFGSRYVDFLDRYDIMSKLMLYIDSNKGILTYPISIEDIQSSNTSNIIPFNSILEMLECYFENMENWFKVETVRSYDESIDDLINRIGYNAMNAVPSYCEFDGSNKILCYISETLREVSQSCYQLKCCWLDGDSYSSDETAKMIRSLISKTCNMFAIPAILMIIDAYYIQQKLDAHNTTKRCVEYALKSIQ